MTSAIPIVIDTDVGADPDDALALILALASPEVDVRGVTIVSGDVSWRARIATRLLGIAGRSDFRCSWEMGNQMICRALKAGAARPSVRWS